MEAINQPKNEVNEKMHNWFENYVATLRPDELALETDVAPEDKKRVYNVLINGCGPRYLMMMSVRKMH